MFFKLRNKILYRKYAQYGYLCDNSLFGYRFLDDRSSTLDEKYVSQSASVMLDVLSKEPQSLDDIVKKLMTVFVGVEFEELKQDTYSFFMYLVHEGYLDCGKSHDECNNHEITTLKEYSVKDENAIIVENCSKQIFKQEDFLRSIHIEIASECNERCVHCYIPHECKVNSIDAALFFRIIEEGRAMNIIHVTLSGGEPLLHKEFSNFLKKCRENDLSVNVLTNLTLLTDTIVEEMKCNPLLSVQTSLYSMNPHVHDSITKVKGSFEKTKAAILKLVEKGIPVQISCPVMKQNKDTFSDVITWGEKHNIPVLINHVIFASYDQSNSNLTNRLTVDEVSDAFCKQLSKPYIDSLKEIAKEKLALTKDNPVCSICRYYFCIAANGDVFPCIGWQTNIIDNLNRTSLRNIWENSKKINYLKEITWEKFPKCLNCKHRGYCTVCMMNNSNESGDIFTIDDYHCKVAAMMHAKVDSYSEKTSGNVCVY